MNSDATCHFCGKESSVSKDLYSCPRCQVRYCSVSCYKHADHSSCSESFYRQWIEDECLPDGDNVFNRSRTAVAERRRIEKDTAFPKKGSETAQIFDFSTEIATETDENTVNEQLQRFGFTDPDDVEELLDALTEEEKEHFLDLVGKGALEKMQNGGSPSGLASTSHADASAAIEPWWSRCSGSVVTETVLDENLPPDHLCSGILNRLNAVSVPARVALTLRYDILNALTAYSLVLRESKLKSFWSATDDDVVVVASSRISHISGSLSGTETFTSSASAVENAFYKATPDHDLRRLVKSDLVIILNNFDWRKGEKADRCQFVFLALCDMCSLFTKARKSVQGSDQRRSLFRIRKKVEFYLKWAESNGDCWKKLSDDTEVVLRTYVTCGTDSFRHNASGTAEVANVSRQKRKEVPTEVVSFVNDQISTKGHGRLFAIVQLDSKQVKITDGDIIVLEGNKRYDVGDQIRLEKVLCVGCANFTLLGRPLVSRDAVNIEATVIEKTLNETQVKYYNAKRHAFHSLQLVRSPISLIRINRIELVGDISTSK